MKSFVEAVLRPTKSKIILTGLTFVVTLVLFIICCCQNGVFLSGIIYSGRGWFGWACLWLTCAWTAIILNTFTMWLLGLTSLKRPRWAFFAVGAAFLLLFLSGLARHVPDPMLGEMGVGAPAALLLYWSLFIEKY